MKFMDEGSPGGRTRPICCGRSSIPLKFFTFHEDSRYAMLDRKQAHPVAGLPGRGIELERSRIVGEKQSVGGSIANFECVPV